MSAVTIFGAPLYTAWDVLTGLPLAGGLVTTYAAGSSTPIATWADYTKTVPNGNPITLSASGTAVIYLIPGVEYKFVVTDQFGTPQYTQDYIEGIPSLSSLAVDSSVSDFRLTLTTGVPVTNTDVTAATTLFCSPYGGRQIALYDSTGVATIYSSAEMSIPVPLTTSQMYDVFCYANAGIPTLELLAWTNDTTRATALTLATTGSYTKLGDLTRRYLGSFRTTTVSGQTEDSAVKRYLWNYYNRFQRSLYRVESTASWTYTTATVRQANASTANQVDIIVGVAEVILHLVLDVTVINTAGGINVQAGIGRGVTNLFSSGTIGGAANVTVSVYTPIQSSLDEYPAVGRQFYSWNEFSVASGTTTWQAHNSIGAGSTNFFESGLSGWITG